MPVQITIEDVPEEFRDALAARAALMGQSLQQFLRCEFVRTASRPTADAWLKEVRDRKAMTGTRVPPSVILEARDADRR